MTSREWAILFCGIFYGANRGVVVMAMIAANRLPPR